MYAATYGAVLCCVALCCIVLCCVVLCCLSVCLSVCPQARLTCTSIWSLLALMLLLTRYGRPDSRSGSLLLLLLLLPRALVRMTPAFSAMKPSTLSALSMPD